MGTRPDLRAHSNAVLDALATGTTKPIGDHEAPDAGGWTGEEGKSAFEPYAVLLQHGADFTGPIGDPYADADVTYEVVCVGLTEEQASWMEKSADAQMSKDLIAVPNRAVSGVIPQSRGTVQRDDTGKPPLYYVRSMYLLKTTPL